MPSSGGRWSGSRPFAAGEPVSDLSLLDTLKARALTGIGPTGTGELRKSDFRKKLRKRRASLFIVFAVDASDSMDSKRRFAVARAAVFSVLKTAYISRDRVALVVFRDQRARVLLRPTSSMTAARKHLGKLRTGGATPLADALLTARRLSAAERRKDPSLATALVLLTDGEANVPLVPGADLDRELSILTRSLRRAGVRSCLVDTGGSPSGGRRLVRLSEELGGTYRRIASPGELGGALREGVMELENDDFGYHPT